MVTNYVVGRIYDIEWTHDNTTFAGSGAHYIEFEQINLESFMDTIVYDVVNDVEYDIRAKNIIFSVTDNGDEFTIDVIDEDNTSHIFISDDVDVKFKNGKCIHNEFFNLTSDVLYMELLNDGEEHFCLYFYNMNCEKNLVDKSSSLTNSRLLNGQLNEQCDILNPSILVDFDGVFEWNYCYVPKFKRYYFVTSVTSVRNKIWRIGLKVDVLYTFETDIRSNGAYITRNENTYDGKLNDERRPLQNIPAVSYYSAGGGNITLNPTYLDVADGRFVAFTSMVAYELLPTGDDYTASLSSDITLPEIDRRVGDNPISRTWGITYSDYQNCAYYLVKNDQEASYVYSAVAFPFNLAVDTINSGLEDIVVAIVNIPIKYGGGSGNVQGYAMAESSDYLVIADFTYPVKFSGEKAYLDYEPYMKHEIYIPFVGWVRVSAVDVLGARILVYYVVSYLTGSGIANIYNVDKQKLIYTAQVQLGIRLPLDRSNFMEISRQEQNAAISGAVGVLSSIAMGMVGVATENPVLIAGSIAGGVTSLIGTATKFNQLDVAERGNVNIGGSMCGLYNPLTVNVRRTYQEPLTIDETTFKHLNGLPLNQYVSSLASVTGYSEMAMHYEPSTLTYITAPEISEIESLAQKGIIL